jgi:hypothetical protein
MEEECVVTKEEVLSGKVECVEMTCEGQARGHLYGSEPCTYYLSWNTEVGGYAELKVKGE